MYCTGGIRCEKATAFMKAEGFDEVYHLKGGILKYLEEVPQEESLWDGACFVFDDRVSVEHGLEGRRTHALPRLPQPDDHGRTASPLTRKAFPAATATKRTDEDRLRYRQRQHQIALAKKRGERHIGS